MNIKYTSKAARELVLHFVLQSIEQKKKGRYLQEIIAMGRRDRVWNQILHHFLEEARSIDFSWKFSAN